MPPSHMHPTAAHRSMDDIRYAAEKYGRVKDVYMPKDFYSGRPRGIAFVEVRTWADKTAPLVGR